MFFGVEARDATVVDGETLPFALDLPRPHVGRLKRADPT